MNLVSETLSYGSQFNLEFISAQDSMEEFSRVATPSSHYTNLSQLGPPAARLVE